MVSLSLRLCASLFAGTMIGVAGGALYPPLTHVAAPLVCDGKPETVSSQYSYKPGQHGVARNVYCIGSDGTREDVTTRIVFLSCLLYALAIFISWPLLTAPSRFLLRRWIRQAGSYAREKLDLPPSADHATATIVEAIRNAKIDGVRRSQTGDATIAERLRQLARLRDEGLITAEDYESRKRDILSEL